MNIKNRLLSLNKVQYIVMAIILIMSCLFASFTYASESMQVNLTSVNGERGSTVSVPLILRNVPASGIYTCSFWVTYNPQIFSSVSITSGNLITNSNDFNTNVNSETGFAAMTFESPADGSRIIKNNGIFAKIEFKIADTAPDGIYNLTYNASRCAVYTSATDEIADVMYQGGTITVGNAAAPTITPTITPTSTSTATPTTSSATVTVKPTPTATTLTGTTMTPSTVVTPTPIPTSAPTDGMAVPKDITTHWAKLYVLRLMNMGVIQGYPDGTIKPDNNVNRAEAVTALMKSIGYGPAGNVQFSFADSSAIPEWVRGFLKTALDIKVVGGYEDNTFRASRNVTRQEVVIMLMKTFRFEAQGSSGLKFADEGKIASWSKNYVNAACGLGIVKGYSDNTFKPDKNVTRAELFTMIAKCLEHLENQQ